MTAGPAAARVLAINTGSSSLKAALYRGADSAGSARGGTGGSGGSGQGANGGHAGDDPGAPLFTALVDRIGSADALVRVTDASGALRFERKGAVDSFGAALTAVLDALDACDPGHRLLAVGHRLVHGGTRFERPERVTADVLPALRELAALAPEHMPQALVAIDAMTARDPAVPQVACFDTAFHRRMPRVAQLIALPERVRERGVLRFGFHGLSYESIVAQLRALGPSPDKPGDDSGRNPADGRIVVAHLGNGASMAALRDGQCIDTTMGFTPTSGLVMGTRAGDVDPGVVTWLIGHERMTLAEVETLLNKESGLLGLSGTSRDMRDLLAAEAADPRAADALALFCYRAMKYVGALAAALGGIDALVFTGGIGEKAAPIRARICEGLGFLGIALDAQANAAHASIVSRPGAAVTVRVLRSDEERTIARHALAALNAGPASARAEASGKIHHEANRT